jgi:hypothetical protein
MKSPLDAQQVLEDFKAYNHTDWLLCLIFLLLAAGTLFVVIYKPTISGKLVPIIIAFLWMIMGRASYSPFHSTINDNENIFGLLFILESILFLRYALIASQNFTLKKDKYGIASSILILYALVFYPVVAHSAGHVKNFYVSFGLPCQSSIFIYGLLLLSQQRLPFYMLVIPFIWSITGFSAAMKTNLYEDAGLVVAVAILIALNSMKQKPVSMHDDISFKNSALHMPGKL